MLNLVYLVRVVRGMRQRRYTLIVICIIRVFLKKIFHDLFSIDTELRLEGNVALGDIAAKEVIG